MKKFIILAMAINTSSPLLAQQAPPADTTPKKTQYTLSVKDVETIDGAIVGSMVFKLQYLLSGSHTSLSSNQRNPEKSAIAKALNLCVEDLSHLSNTKGGKHLKQEGEKLIELLEMAMLGTMALTSSPKEQKKFEKYFRAQGLQTHNGISPIELANLVRYRIKAFNKLAKGPEWELK